MKIKILIVGLGGVGGYYGGFLARKYQNDPFIDIYFLSRGIHLEMMRNNGLKVITEDETFVAKPSMVTDKIEEVGKVDYVLLTTKSYDLDETIEQIKPCIVENTVILPLLNGIDISTRIRNLLPHIQVWNGCVYIVGRLNEPGVVESSGGVHDLFFGYEDRTTEQLLFMEKIMQEAGIKAKFCDNIRFIIWRKFIFISATASLTSYFNVGFRDILTEESRKEITLKVINEITAIANADGVSFPPESIDTIIKHIERLPFSVTSSMHTDFKAGRKTELNTLTKIVIDLGEKYKIPTPTYKMVYNKLSK